MKNLPQSGSAHRVTALSHPPPPIDLSILEKRKSYFTDQKTSAGSCMSKLAVIVDVERIRVSGQPTDFVRDGFTVELLLEEIQDGLNKRQDRRWGHAAYRLIHAGLREVGSDLVRPLLKPLLARLTLYSEDPSDVLPKLGPRVGEHQAEVAVKLLGLIACRRSLGG
jgi:hypothetical protein